MVSLGAVSVVLHRYKLLMFRTPSIYLLTTATIMVLTNYLVSLLLILLQLLNCPVQPNPTHLLSAIKAQNIYTSMAAMLMSLLMLSSFSIQRMLLLSNMVR